MTFEDPKLATPWDICTCAHCGPPWRGDTPRPADDAPLIERLSWGSYMALCPTCGNKRCPAAANHENTCSGSNDPGQAGSQRHPGRRVTATIGVMPNKPKTPLRAFRIEDELWLEAVRVAGTRGESVSETLRDALKRYVKKYGQAGSEVSK